METEKTKFVCRKNNLKIVTMKNLIEENRM